MRARAPPQLGPAWKVGEQFDVGVPRSFTFRRESEAGIMSADHFLTPKQKQVLAFILEYQAKHSYAPTQQEIAREFGFSSLGTVQNYLVRLERQGLLKKTWNGRRSLQPQPLQQKLKPLRPQSQANLALLKLPVLGQVAAGRPIEAIDQHQEIEVPAAMVKMGEHFILRVVGDSMIEDGILDGDCVVIRKAQAAENGETVVALIQNEATIKRFYRKDGVIELHPANPKYQPIRVGAEDRKDFSIAGVLTGVFRLL